MKVLRYAAPLLALTLAVGCGSGNTTSSPSAGSASGAAPSASGAATGPAQPKPSLSPGAGPRGIPTTIVGTVSVRQGSCLLFTPGDMAQSWVLTGAIDGLKPGKGYTLEGQLMEDATATCPQGPEFQVRRAVPTS